MTKPRVCLVYTGGTIGMVEEEGVRRPPDDPQNFLDIAPELADFVNVEPVYVTNKDSTDMNPSDWVKVANAIYDRRNEGYQGFVVPHGTDTMHFAAAAVGYAFGTNLNFPIVFTGAQTPANVVHGDARINLLRACRTALEPLAEVMIAFGDYVFRACRAQKKHERQFDAFESPAFPPLAYVTETIDLQPLVRHNLPSDQEKAIIFRPHFSEGIYRVSLNPGLKTVLVQQAVRHPDCTGVILESYGAGNVPWRKSGDDYSFEPMVKELVKMGKPVILTSQFPGGSTLNSQYESHLDAVDAGAIPTGNMVSSSAFVKFSWVLARVDEEIGIGVVTPADRFQRIEAWMQRCYIGELGPMTVRFTDPDPIDDQLVKLKAPSDRQ